MTQKTLGKNQLAVLEALSQLPANQAPFQIYEEMRSQQVYVPRTVFSQTLGNLAGKGYLRREGVAPAFYYSLTKAGKEALKSAQEVQKAIATINSAGAKL